MHRNSSKKFNILRGPKLTYDGDLGKKHMLVYKYNLEGHSPKIKTFKLTLYIIFKILLKRPLPTKTKLPFIINHFP